MEPVKTPLPRLMAFVLAGVLACPAPGRAEGTHEKGDTPPVISHGSKIDLADYLVPGKTTVFDFYSVHCPTCMALKPGLERLHAARADIAVVMVDVDRPGSKASTGNHPWRSSTGFPRRRNSGCTGPTGSSWRRVAPPMIS